MEGRGRESLPTQMQSVIDVGTSFMAGLHCWFSDFMEAARESPSANVSTQVTRESERSRGASSSVDRRSGLRPFLVSQIDIEIGT